MLKKYVEEQNLWANAVYLTERMSLVLLMCLCCGSEERSVTLSTWCVSTRWPDVHTTTWCSTQSFPGWLPITTHRLLVLNLSDCPLLLLLLLRLSALSYLRCLTYLSKHIKVDWFCQVADVETHQQLQSSWSLSLIVSRTWLFTANDRAFPVIAARVWNSAWTVSSQFAECHFANQIWRFWNSRNWDWAKWNGTAWTRYSCNSLAVFWFCLKTHLSSISYFPAAICMLPIQWGSVALDIMILMLVCFLLMFAPCWLVWASSLLIGI